MAVVSPQRVKELRDRTGAGVMDCKRALEEAGGDLDRATEILRTKGQATAEKRAGREAREGLIASYIHTGGRIGVLIEVNCESDFVARTDQFGQLVRELAVQVAATYPAYVDVDQVPPEALDARRAAILADPLVAAKPEAVRERIVEGQLKKWYAEPGGVLYEQPFRDKEFSVRQRIADAIAAIGENIRVRRFVLFRLGE